MARNSTYNLILYIVIVITDTPQKQLSKNYILEEQPCPVRKKVL